MAARLARSIPVQVLGEKGARTDETHVSFENVDKLGQFIQAPFPHPQAKWRHPVCVRQKVPFRIPQVVHRPKLVQVKNIPS